MLRSFLITLFICSSLVACQTCSNGCTAYNIAIVSDPTQDKAVGVCSSELANAIELPITGTSWKAYSPAASSAKYITDCISTNPLVYTQNSVRYITRSFNLNCAPTVAYINCKSKGTATLFVNGVQASMPACKAPEVNVGLIQDPSSLLLNLQEGVNVIEWRLESVGINGATSASNPNGLLYNLRIIRI